MLIGSQLFNGGIGGAAPTVNYQFQATWDSAGDQTYVNATNYDLDSEGVEDGDFTAKIGINTTIEAASNELKHTLSSAASGEFSGLVTNDLTLATGVLMRIDQKINNTSNGYTTAISEIQGAVSVFPQTGMIRFTPVTSVPDYLIFQYNGAGTVIENYRLTTALTPAANQYDTIVFIFGGHDSSGNPIFSGDTASNFQHGCHIFIRENRTGDYKLAIILEEYDLISSANIYAHALKSGGTSFIANNDNWKVTDSLTTYLDVLYPVVGDKFTTTFGTADTGQTWTQQSGTWSVSSGKATCNGAGIATIDASTGAADVIIKAILNTGTGNPSIVFRWSDSNNYWYVQLDNTSNIYELHEVNGGSDNVRDSASITIANSTDYSLQVRIEGSNVEAWFDGDNNTKLVYTTATLNQTATIHGIKTDATSPTFDNFTVRKVVDSDRNTSFAASE